MLCSFDLQVLILQTPTMNMTSCIFNDFV